MLSSIRPFLNFIVRKMRLSNCFVYLNILNNNNLCCYNKFLNNYNVIVANTLIYSYLETLVDMIFNNVFELFPIVR